MGKDVGGCFLNLFFEVTSINYHALFLHTFPKLQKETTGSVMSVCPSIRPHGTIWLLL